MASLPYPLHTRTYYYVPDPRTGLPFQDSLVCGILLEWLPRMSYMIQACQINVSNVVYITTTYFYVITEFAQVVMSYTRGANKAMPSDTRKSLEPHEQGQGHT